MIQFDASITFCFHWVVWNLFNICTYQLKWYISVILFFSKFVIWKMILRKRFSTTKIKDVLMKGHSSINLRKYQYDKNSIWWFDTNFWNTMCNQASSCFFLVFRIDSIEKEHRSNMRMHAFFLILQIKVRWLFNLTSLNIFSVI